MTPAPSSSTGPVSVGIDLGTSSVKVVALDEDGGALAESSAPYPVLAPRSRWAETPAPLWWDAVVRATRALPPQVRRRCVGVGLSGQMHGVVLADASGHPLRPALLHADTRSTTQLAAYRDLPPEARARLRNPLSPNMAGPMLLWIQQNEPGVAGAARWAVQPKDWIRWRLTGEVGAEPSDASATLLYDVVGRCWDDDVVARLGLDRSLLAPLLDRSSSPAGTTTRAAADELGLPAGVVVAAGGGDTAVAALGSGAVGRGGAQLTIGTGGQIITSITGDDVVLPGDAATEPTTHLYRDVADGWYAMAAVLNAGLALDWARTALAATWDELYAAAATPVRAASPVFVPHLTGERTPFLDPSLRASWTGVELAHTRTDLLRAALEGVALNLREALEALPGVDPGAPLLLAGGGTAGSSWRALLADVLQRPLRVLTTSGASGRGAAVLGALAAGRVDAERVRTAWDPPAGPLLAPRPGSAALVDERRDRFRRAVSGQHAA